MAWLFSKRYWSDKESVYKHLLAALLVLKVLILVTIIVLLYIVLYQR
jgi:hypothetical protein